jgi:hypothetical protein
MNLTVLKKRGAPPHVGDVFALLPPDGAYLFGRVISVDANAGGFRRSNLIYIYRARSRDKTPPLLERGDLLVPPIMTNNLPWSRGYFERVERGPLLASDVLPAHCFKDPLRDLYYDEGGRPLSAPVPPVGDLAMHSFRTIDDAVSEALGLPLAPDEP